MEQFNKLFKNILLEQDMDVFKVGVFPGAFKPPHIGHFTTAYNACKDNDLVYIFVSDKPRPLSTQNKGGVEVPDINRYSNIMKSDKYTSNLLGVQPAGVARMTSATAFRTAISVKDKNTIAKNLPEGVDTDSIFSILMRSNDISDPGYGHVTVDQTMEIWSHYKPLLQQLSGLPEDRLKIIVSKPSPVKDTYDLVDRLNNSEQAGNTSVRLYVGE
jgi:cytidyltransferase-like protein